MNRDSLYRTLSEQGNPKMSTFESLVDLLRFALTLYHRSGQADRAATTDETDKTKPKRKPGFCKGLTLNPTLCSNHA